MYDPNLLGRVVIVIHDVYFEHECSWLNCVGSAGCVMNEHVNTSTGWDKGAVGDASGIFLGEFDEC